MGARHYLTGNCIDLDLYCAYCGKKLEVVGKYCPFCGNNTSIFLFNFDDREKRPPTIKDKFISFLKAEVAFIAGFLAVTFFIHFLPLPVVATVATMSACFDTMNDKELPRLRLANTAIIMLLLAVGFAWHTYEAILTFPGPYRLWSTDIQRAGHVLVLAHAFSALSTFYMFVYAFVAFVSPKRIFDLDRITDRILYPKKHKQPQQ